MAVAPPILPTESEVTVLSSAAPLASDLVEAALSEGLTFRSGVECSPSVIESWPIGCAPDLDPDEEGTWKALNEYGGDVSFLPFFAHMFFWCEGAPGVNRPIDARRAAELKVAFDAGKHRAIAEQLWFGHADSTNPSLRDVATVPSGWNTADDIVAVIAKLVAHRHSNAGGLVNIHGPWLLVPYLMSLTLLVRRNGRFEGEGFVYVVDDAYPTDTVAGPIQTPGSPPTYYADVASTAWLYASGRFEYVWGPYLDNRSLGLSNQDEFSAYTVWDHRQNKSLLRVEQTAFLRFDPCEVVAHRVTIPV